MRKKSGWGFSARGLLGMVDLCGGNAALAAQFDSLLMSCKVGSFDAKKVRLTCDDDFETQVPRSLLKVKELKGGQRVTLNLSRDEIKSLPRLSRKSGGSR